MTSVSRVSPENIDLTVTTQGVADFVDTVMVDLSGHGTVDPVIPRVDVYFLCDTTGSMGAVINAVKAGVGGSQGIIRKMISRAQSVGADLALGVGEYKDFTDEYAFKNIQAVTDQVADANNNVVIDAVNRWAAAGGGDYPEAQFYALDQLAQPPGGSIGWRPNTKRIVVWIGDVPSHDPISSALTGLSYNITQESVIQKLSAEHIIVLAINVGAPPGLNTNNQAAAIAVRTWGAWENSTADQVVNTINSMVGTYVAAITRVSWAADNVIAPFVTVNPTGDEPAGSTTTNFNVSFGHVVTTSDTAAAVETEGYIDVSADGVPVGRQAVKIRTPDLTGTYKIQSEQFNHLFLQINDAWGWTVNVGEGTPDREPFQKWELIRYGNRYALNNLYDPNEARNPTDPHYTGRRLEVPGYNDQNNVEIITRRTTGGDTPGGNQLWRLQPMGMDGNGVICILVMVGPPPQKRETVIDLQGATREQRKVVMHHYWGNVPHFQRGFGQHWRLVPL